MPFLPGCPAGSWRLLAAGCCWRPLMAVMLLVGIGQIGYFVSNAAYFLVVGAAWCWVLPGGGCCLGLMPFLPGCPAGSWRLLAAGCCWRPLMAVMLLVGIGQIGYFVSNAAYFLVVGAAWCWVLPGGGCCLGLMPFLPGCPAGSWRLLAAGCCWRPLMAVMLLVGIGHLSTGVNILFPHHPPCRPLCLFGAFGIFCRVVHLDGARTQEKGE